MPPAEDSQGTWTLPDVYLLADTADGRVAIPHLQLEFDAAGITLAKDNDELAWSSGWNDLRELWTAERSVLPDGGEGIVLVVMEKGGRPHRFVLPTDEAATLEERLRDLALAHRLRTHQPPRAALRSISLAVILACAATLTVLLLSAAHVIRF